MEKFMGIHDDRLTEEERRSLYGRERWQRIWSLLVGSISAHYYQTTLLQDIKSEKVYNHENYNFKLPKIL